jgi:hypothetical protein
MTTTGDDDDNDNWMAGRGGINKANQKKAQETYISWAAGMVFFLLISFIFTN